MKRVKFLLIGIHLISNFLIQYTINISAFTHTIQKDNVLSLQVFCAVVILSEAAITLLLRKRIRETVGAREVTILQLADLPLAVMGYIIVYVLMPGESSLLVVFTASVELFWLTERVILLLLSLSKMNSVTDIDHIMYLLEDNNSETMQKKGRVLADSVEAYYIFIMPARMESVWNNCAQILSKKKDIELKPYMMELFQWIQGNDRPGSKTIYDRLMTYQKDEVFHRAVKRFKAEAMKKNDIKWLERIQELEKIC